VYDVHLKTSGLDKKRGKKKKTNSSVFPHMFPNAMHTRGVLTLPARERGGPWEIQILKYFSLKHEKTYS
jgi:hypothetical protein